MEIWFLGALGSALGSGLSAFLIKVAAKRNYGSEVFILWGGIFSVAIFLPVAILFSEPGTLKSGMVLLALMAGFLAATVGIFKVYALRHIDTTIYYPLFKLISPALAIVFGILLFAETFTAKEWIGLLAGLFVPLMLITKSENGRQANLLAGLVLVVITGILASVISVLNKYAVDIYQAIFWILAFNSIGITVGSFLTIMYKRGIHQLSRKLLEGTTKILVIWAAIRSMFISLGFLSMLYAFSVGGSLGVVYTIQSFYILIPIILSIIFYEEHWNLQKATAIILSVAALALLG